MHAGDFDEGAFFAAIAASSCRALLIGRRALVAYGIPVLTADYDFWLDLDDVDRFCDSLAPLGFVPDRSAAEARSRGRFALENSERVDVLLGRSEPTVDGARVAFDDIWDRREIIEARSDVQVCVPSLADLIATKRFGSRPKDAEDIRLLRALALRRGISL